MDDGATPNAVGQSGQPGQGDWSDVSAMCPDQPNIAMEDVHHTTKFVDVYFLIYSLTIISYSYIWKFILGVHFEYVHHLEL